MKGYFFAGLDDFLGVVVLGLVRLGWVMHLWVRFTMGLIIYLVITLFLRHFPVEGVCVGCL